MKYNYMRYPGGKAKAFTMSYDDGPRDDERFLETINKYGLKCTFNLVGGTIEGGSSWGMSSEYIKENIIGKGHEIANHGYNHRAHGYVRPVDGIRDVLESRLFLEREFGMIVRGFAFPDRMVSKSEHPEDFARIREYLSDLGIVYARIAGGDNDKFELPRDFYNWTPTAHHANPRVLEYAEKFVNMDVSKLYIAQRTPKLFYLWGHSFEFSANNNWELLEDICKALGKKDDIWYATNIEIYDYVKAYESLVFSADGTLVYNPTLTDVWFDIDGTLYVVKSGESKVVGK